MRHRIWIGVLVLGVVLGFGSGIAHVIHGRGGCRFHEDRRRAFMHEVSEECVRAARQEDRESRREGRASGDDRGPRPLSFAPPPPAAPTVIFVPMPVPAGTVQSVQFPQGVPAPPPAPSP